MPFQSTDFPGLMIYEPKVFEDSRGYFFESYNQKEFDYANQSFDFVQDNQSRSTYGVIRGLHYQQSPFAQTKLVRVLSGNIWDVAVDLRKGSPTYAKVFGIELSSSNRLQLLIPKGFAHGFSVISEFADVLYKCDNYYNKQSEGSIIWNDPQLAIDWKIAAEKAIISEKDILHPLFSDSINNFHFGA
jgi:dTDP-4-dehydrorhamnose 3,5-epimerase